MEIGEPRKIVEFLSTKMDVGRRLFLDASGEALKLDGEARTQSDWLAAIGPEGGWTEQEIAAGASEFVGGGNFRLKNLACGDSGDGACSRICID